MPAERLQKVMAAAGIGSRRTCETLISEGRVQVNGKTVSELGAKADPGRDRITVDGKRLEFQLQHVYYKVHKPRGVISDIGGDEVDLRTGELRKTVDDLLPPGHPRVFPVGRLDLHSEGLVLLTDDGELANRLTHPRYQHPKTYYVLLGEQPSQEALIRLRNGVDIPEGRSAPAEVMIISHLPATLKLSKGPNEGVWLRVVLREGKKRQIRHMTAAVGYPTLRLLRWAIGPLTLGNLELGQSVPLTTDEINALRQLADLPTIKVPTQAPRSRAPERGSRAGGSRRDSRAGAAPTGPAKRMRLAPASKRTTTAKVAFVKAGSEQSPARESTPGKRSTGSTGTSSRSPGGRPPSRRPTSSKSAGGRSPAGNPTSGGPAGSRQASGKPSGGRPASGRPGDDRPSSGRPSSGRPASGRPASDRPASDRPASGRPPGRKPTGGKPAGGKPAGGKPAGRKYTKPSSASGGAQGSKKEPRRG
jgi:23S rRNA pseudouridine2605 synthase